MSSITDRRIAELQNQVERLFAFIDDVVPVLVDMADDKPALGEALSRLAAVEARQPRPRFTAPPGWLSAQEAAHECGMSLATFYRKWRKLGVVGVKFDEGCLRFDPSSLPVRKR